MLEVYFYSFCPFNRHNLWRNTEIIFAAKNYGTSAKSGDVPAVDALLFHQGVLSASTSQRS